MTARRCLDCPNLISHGSRCRSCERRHTLGWAWPIRRAAWLLLHPNCAVCGAKATEVDHVVRRADGGGDHGNLQSLCRTCHRATTTAEARR